jgi:hypothetical protein
MTHGRQQQGGTVSEESPHQYAAMTIPVLPGYMAVRKRPEMYFGVAHDDPRLPEMILRWVIRDTPALPSEDPDLKEIRRC